MITGEEYKVRTPFRSLLVNYIMNDKIRIVSKSHNPDLIEIDLIRSNKILTYTIEKEKLNNFCKKISSATNHKRTKIFN